ncbi:thioredoxin domain-containing protein [Halorubellus sp. JP-L1]|uniref:DsbA family protein n=1 Tax=Halorubellus sp. JP-L1 TaxID=2715753 RepID=UPI001409A77A|nr:thioredoxin domain-containing protein [Halorubellus sp. JP-L1]NHN42877.1 thioredoxin domain-containing protein [Halorubellus sp. JP-L1]
MDARDNITRRRALLAGGGLLAFGGGVAYVASQSGSNEQHYVPETSHSSDETGGFGIELAGRPIAGERDAKVDLYYWTDYLCPFCKEFETETLPEIGREYIDTGDVRLVALSYPNIGQYSMPAAVWGRCVWSQVAESDPAAFWNWHSAVYDEQPESGKDWADDETFAAVTERTDGVDVAAVESCREDRADSIRESMDPNLGVAQEAGIRGTPGFVVYNRESGAAGKLVGAHPYENFADAIDQVSQS